MPTNISQLYWNVWDEAKRARYRARHNGQAPPRPAPYTLGPGQWGPTTGPYGNYPHVAPGPFPPGTPGVAGNGGGAAGAPNPPRPPGAPPVQPFSTSGNLQDLGNLEYETSTGKSGLAAALADAEIRTNERKEEIKKAALRSITAGRDEFAARGLQNSSIRDAALFDVDQQATLESTRLDSALDRLRLSTADQIKALEDRLANYRDVVLPLAQVENAAAVTPALPPEQGSGAGSGNANQGVTWAVWNSWSPAQRARYRDRHRNDWDNYRPH